MRTHWVVLVGLVSLSSLGPGCSSSGGTTGGSTSAGTSSGGTTGGSSTGGTNGGSTSGGTTGGGKAPGAPCAGNAECASSLCGVDDSSNGHCCTAACPNVTAPCGATDCTSTGACAYPTSSTACGSTCTGSTLTPDACDGAGACVPSNSAPCPNHLACNGATACYTQCTSGTTECAAGFYCASGACVPQLAAGQPCTSDVSCALGICGVNGTGNCCVAKCDTTDPVCAATACDGQGLCTYPTNQLQCRAPSCSGDTLTEATSCNGAGICPAVVTTDCTPYACSGTPSACATSCTTGGSSCASGGFCDFDNHCCSGLASGGTIAVDGATGADGTCCGIGTNQACQTLERAMQLIDEAQAANVTIVATVNGGGGDWPLVGNAAFPIILGWGAVLSAPGVFFVEPLPSSNPLEIFDIVAAYSANDTVGYASIVGSAQSPVSVGMDSANNQTDSDAAIRVEPGATLYLANASVNSAADGHVSFTALDVSAGATLVLGQDQSGGVTGTVTIGNALGVEATDGNIGILCESDYVISGCTIQDAALTGQSSVVIQGQRGQAIQAQDFSTISLSSNPVIGVPPNGVGFDECPQKNDGVLNPEVSIQGPTTMTFRNGVVQCLHGTGFLLQRSPFGNGMPALNLDNCVIQNTELGIRDEAGTATVTNTTIQYNVIGLEQAQDVAGNNGAVDLSGGGNTIICSSNAETSQGYKLPGIDVYNTSTADLNASNVAWDTATPDYFDCDSSFACTCNLIFGCTTKEGSDDMDAVEDSTNLGGITTTGATQKKGGCN